MASSGEGIPLDGINQGGKSQGEEGKITNKNKQNNKQKGSTSSNPSKSSSEKVKKSKSKFYIPNSVHPETSNTETETRDAPNKAASPPSPTPAEDVEEFSDDQHKDEKQKSSKGYEEKTVTPIGIAGNDPALQPEEHGLNPSSGDTMNESENTKNVEVMALEMKRLQDEIKRLKEDFGLKEEENKRLRTKINEKVADTDSYLKVIKANNAKIQNSEENIQRLIKQIDTLGAENAENVVNITEMKNFQLEILNREADLLKTKAAWEKKAKDLESRFTKQLTNMEDLRGKLQSSKNKSEGLKEKLKESEKECSRIKKEKDETVKGMDKRISSLDSECKRLNETIDQRTQQLNQYYSGYTQGVTEISRLNAEVHKLKQQITSLRKTVQDLEIQKEDLMLRLSKIAGANLTYNNPNIADLSDEKRPTKLAEEFSELYDNEWTDAFEEVEAEDDKSRTKFLYDVLRRASEYCTDLSTGHDAAIKRSFTTLKYEVTVPVTENSEHDKDTPNGATDSTTADQVEMQDHDESTSKDATEAVQMDNEDGQENENTNNDLLSDNKPQKDDKQENKEDDDFVEINVDDATVAESVEATKAMNATTVSSKNEASLDKNTETQNEIEQDEASPKKEDEQVLRSADKREGESDGNTMTGDGKRKDQTAEDGKEPKETTGAKDEQLLHSPDRTTIQGGDEDAQPEEASDGASGDKVIASGETTEDTKCGHAENASSQKDGQTTQINNHEDKNDVENDKSVDRPDNEDSSLMEGNNSTNDTKPKGEGANTDPPTNENSETVYDTNGDALGTSVDKIDSNSGQHDKNDKGAHGGDGKETCEDVNTQSGENNESTIGSPRENKQPTTNTIEISKIDFNFDDLSKEHLKIIMDLKKSLEVQQSEDVKTNGARIIADAMNVSKESEEMMKYILKCIDICWSMHRHEPPVYINFTSPVDGQRFEKNVYRPYTKFGKHIDYVVWPSLHLHKDGPMLGKGVAQGK